MLRVILGERTETYTEECSFFGFTTDSRRGSSPIIRESPKPALGDLSCGLVA